jgi:integration host factor subunit beta
VICSRKKWIHNPQQGDGNLPVTLLDYRTLLMKDAEFVPSMTKSDLIDNLSRNQGHLAYKDVELAVKSLIEMMSSALSNGERIEIRGFGSFSLHYRPPRTGRNPKSGEKVDLPGKYVPHFKPGKELRDRANNQK